MPDKNLCLQYLKTHRKSVSSYWGLCDQLAIDTRTWLEEKGYQGFMKVLYIKSAHKDSIATTYDRALGKDLRILHPENVRIGADNFFYDEDGDPVLEWYFHAALSVDGKIHDVWKPEVVDEETYFTKGFKQKIEVIPEEEWNG